MKHTYYAIVDGKEKIVRKSEHEYHFFGLGSFAKTKEEVIARAHSYFFMFVNDPIKYPRCFPNKKPEELREMSRQKRIEAQKILTSG